MRKYVEAVKKEGVTFDFKAMLSWTMVLVALIVAMFSFSSNPYANTTSSDGAVFAYMGEAMSRGLVLYRDVVDNKGPMLYWFNYVGKFFSDNMVGVWCIEVILFILSMLMSFVYIKKRFGTKSATRMLFVHAFLYMLCAAPGNFSETYAYPFIVLPVLLLSLWTEENRWPTFWEAFLTGCSFSVVFLLRVNMVTFAFAIAIFLLVQCGITRSFSSFIRVSVTILSGVFVVLLPWVVYFWIHNAFDDLLQIYWFANLVHIGHKTVPHAYTWLCPIIVLLNVAAWCACELKYRRSLLFNLLYALLASVVICIKPSFDHYFLPLVAAVVCPLGVLFNRYDKISVGAYLVFPFSLVIMLKSNYDLRGLMNAVRAEKPISSLRAFVDGRDAEEALPLKRHIRDTESVCVMGLDCGVYSKLGVHCKGRYLYQACLVDMLPEIREEIRKQFLVGTNRYVIVRTDQWVSGLRDIIESKYHKLGGNGHYSLYEFNVE